MKKLITILSLLGALTLSACSTTSGADAGPTISPVPVAGESSPATEDPAPSPEGPVKSIRGNVIKTVPEPVWLTNIVNGEEIGSMVVKEITDVTCTNPYASAAVNGKLIGLAVDLETFPELAEMIDPNVYLTGADFGYVDPNGTTFNASLVTAATFGCLDESQTLQMQYGPNERATGMIILDIPAQSGGILTYYDAVEWVLP